ncbi:MAG: hypothetical protein AVDCRST_MAG01-01-218, partial [uncultured Rubrobacteraceae bacterium]
CQRRGTTSIAEAASTGYSWTAGTSRATARRSSPVRASTTNRSSARTTTTTRPSTC